MNRLRRLHPLAPGALALALGVLVSTCRLGDLVKHPISGTLQVAPTNLVDSAATGSQALRVTSVSLDPVGTGQLSYHAVRAKDSPWLGLSSTSGMAPTTISVMLDPQGLAAGVYQDTIVFTSNNSAAAPMRVPVVFTVHDCRVTPISADTTVSGSLTTGDCAAPHRSGRFARLFSFSGQAGDSLTLELDGTGLDGYLVLDTSLTPGAPAFAQVDDCGGFPGDPCLFYQPLPVTGTYTVEVTTSPAGQTGGYALSVHHPRLPLVADTLRQLRADSVTVIATGTAINQTTVVLRASVRDSDAVDSLRIEVELQPLAVSFTGVPTAVSPRVANGGRAYIRVTGLADDESYHWQIRTLDQTGRRSAWTSFGGNAETAADFTIGIPQAPNAPGSLAQFKADGVTAIAIGGTNETRSVVLRGVVTDADPGDALRLDVEVQPVGTPFTNVPGGSSVTASSGTTVTVTIPGLVNNTAYHWQARTVDQTTRASAWTPFGGNLETDPDFTVAIQATQLVFTVQPGTTAAGAAITPAVQVTARDAVGGTVSSFSDSITIDLAANPAGGTLSGTRTVAAVNGVATFSNLRLDKAGAGYQLRATSPALTATSATFSVIPGAPAQLVFTTQPVTTAAGSPITPAVQVTAKDASGNVVTNYIANVTVALGNAAGATLFGTLTKAAVSGVATFNDLTIDKAGSGYTLLASDGTRPQATSAAFDILPQGAATLVFTIPPSDAVAGTAIAPAVQVTAQDNLGNPVTSFTDTVTVALAAVPAGATLRGTIKRKAVNGVATFSDLRVDKAQAGYSLIATAGTAGSGASPTFDITPAPASTLAFITAPSTTTAGAAIAPAVQVSARDSLGNAVPGFTDTVVIAIAANPGGGTLSGTGRKAAVNGTASFADLSIDRAALSYTLGASAVGLTGATSASFDVTPGVAARLVFTVQPSTTAAGATITPAVEVTARDALGNTATGYNGSVTVAIGANPAAGTLLGTTTVGAANGVATFANLSIDHAGQGYTLTAGGAGLPGDTTISFDITSGAAGRLTLLTPPSGAAQSGASFAQQPAVQLEDLSGNPVLQAGVTVTASVASGPGGSSLSNSTATTNAQGVATFSGLGITGLVGTYTLSFSAGGVTPATSGAIALSAGAAAKLAITTQPSATAQNGLAFAQQPGLQVQDAAGNAVAQNGTPVTVAIGSGGGALSGGTTVNTDAQGVVAFVDLTITGTAGPHTLDFTAPALAGVSSTTVQLQAGPATQLAVNGGDGQTATAGTAVATPPSVIARDQSGNPVAGVAVAFGVLSGGGTVNPTAPVNTDASGVAAVTTWTLGPTAGTNTLGADATGLAGGPVVFTATATVGAAANLAKSSGDNLTGPVGTTLGTPHEVLITDANGNPVAGVTVNWSVPLGQGSVNPTSSVTDVNGHAQTTRTLGATPGPQTTTANAALAGGPANVTFAITATVGGAANMVKFGGDGQVDTVGATLATALAVRVTDQFTNPVQGVQITWSVLDGGGAVTPTTSFTDINGVATTSWTLGTQLTPTDSTQLVQATGAGAPANFVATTRPGGVDADSTRVTASPATIAASAGGSASTITVTARDGFGNRIPGKAVTLAVTGSGNTLAQPASSTNAQGIATGTLFSSVAEVKTVTASVAGLAIVQQATVTVQPAAANTLLFLTQPTTAAAGSAISPAVRVEIRDAFGNLVSGATNGVSVALGANPGGGTLSGTTPVSAAGGVATFSNLSIDKVGTGYTLVATASGLAGATSTPFDITPGGPAVVAVSAGNGQTATVGTAVAIAPAVLVTDAHGNPVPGVTVTFTPSGNGSVTGGTPVTDAAGIATVGSWTLATTAGANTLSASTAGLLPATFSATGAPGSVSAAQSSVSAAPGAFTAGGGPATVTVVARDAFSNPVPGAAVSFAVTGSGNSLTQPATGTDAGGTATGTFTSTVAETKTVSATADGVALTQTASVTVTAGAVSAGLSTVVAAPTALTAGSGSSTITVTALDAFGNPVSGAAVALGVTGAGNTVGAPTPTSGTGVSTATFSSTGSGVKTVSATVNGVAITQTATITVTAAAATQLFFRVNPAGATAGVAFSPAIEVSARDQFNNRDSTFAGNIGLAIGNNAGGGTLTGGAPVAPVKGLATFAGVSIDKAGSGYTLTASAGGLTSATSGVFDISPAAATQIAVSAGDGQSATAGTSVTVPPSVVVRDQFGNAVAGVNVTFAVASGGGSVVPTTPVATGASGIAQVTSWTLGPTTGPNSLTATAGSLTGSPVTFTATATAGSATTIALSGGNAQTDTAGATLPVPYAVLVTDAGGNAVSGITVTWTAAGGGSITPTSVTNGSGIATATRVLGTTAGAQTATASVGGLSGSPVAFTATATAATPTQLAVNAGNGQSATVNTTVATPPSVVVRDQFNNPVGGVAVTYAVGLGGGTVAPTSPVTTTAAGIAQATSWTLGTIAGTNNNTLTATPSGVTGNPVVTFTASATAGAATQIALNGGDNQSAQVGVAVPVAPSVIVRDQFSNPVAGVSVAFAVASGGGSVNPTTPLTTNAAGIAQVTSWTLGVAAGTNTLNATSTGLTGSPVTFTATGFAGSATQIALNGGDGQTDTVGATLATVYSVIVRDASNNPVQGVPVGWTVTGGGGTILPATSNTNASGIATATRTLGTTAGAQTATASVGGLTGSPVTFTATANHGVATQVAVSAGNGQTATVNTAVATPPAVVVRDQFGNPVAGIGVTFAAALGGGSATGTSATTDASGIATVGSWTLGTTAGTNTLTATSAGLTGSPVTFTATASAGAVSAAQSTVTAAPGTITASNGASAATITVTARDAFGNPIGGAPVVLSAAPTSGNTLTQPALTNGSGVATGTLSSTVAETKTVTATVNGTLVTQTATVTVATDGVVSAAQSTVSAAPGSLTAGGGASTITVTARDAFGNPIGGATVGLAATGSGNTLTQPTGLTDAAGAATGTLASTVAETKTVSATIGGTLVSQTAAVTVTAGAVSASQSTVAAVPATIAASSGSSASTITVTARDAFNNPVSGATVVLVATGTGNTLTQPAVTSGAGVTTGTLSSTVAEAKTVSATINGLAITQTAPVTVTVGAVSASQSTVTAAPSPITAGSGTATITVTAKDAFGNAISGATVALTAAPLSGNTLVQPAAPTDASGVATGSLGSTVAELKTVSATINGTLVTQTAAVTVVTDGVVSAAQSTVAATPGSITASTGSSAATVTVTARDQFGNVISGASVSLAATGSANAFAPSASGTTNGSGVLTAAFSSTAAEAKTVSATIDGTAVTQTASVTVTAGTVSATQTTVVAAPASIAVSAGTATITVTARDAFANPVGGAGVTLAATGTGNTLTQPAPTDAAGVATGTLSSTVMGTKTISATVGGVLATQTPAVAVTPGPASQLLFTVQPTSPVAGVAITPAVQVTAQDAFGNTDTAYTGTVTMAIAANPGGATLSGTVNIAATSGVALFSTLSLDKSGTGYTLGATASGVNGDTSTAFSVSPAGVSQLIFDVQPSTTPVNGTITPALRVRKADPFGNTVVNPRRDIQLTINTNPGGALFSGTATVLTQRTGAAGTADSGVAVFDTVRLDKIGVGYVLRAHATAGAAADQLSAAFDITAGAPTTVALFAGNGQTDTVGATLATPYQVRVADALNNPVSGVTVTWAVTGGGTIAVSSVTNGSGIASATRVLGTAAGSQGATATVGGLTGSPVAFTATATAGTATQIAVNGGDGQSATAGSTVAIAPAVIVQDGFGNPKAGVSVTFTVTGGGGTTSPASGSSVTTGSNGIAALTSWTLGTVAGTNNNTLSAASGSLTGSPVAFTASATAGAVNAGHSSVSASPGLIAASSGGTTSTVTVTARDQFDNPVSGATVVLAATGTANTLTQPGLTNGSGVATGAISSTKAEAKTVSATANAVAISQSSLVIVQPAAAASIAVQAGDGQSATAGTAVATAPAVLVQDQFANPVANLGVSFAVATGGGSVTGGSATTNGSGIATVGSWTLGTTAGANTLTATATGGGITGNPVTFTATGTAGAAQNLVYVSGDAQTDTVGATLAAYVVRVTDTNGNGVSGVTVTWNATGGGTITGTATATTSITNATGHASATRVLGTTPGAQGATATSGSLTGSPVAFSATATTGTAAAIALNAGNAQSDTVGATLPVAYAVLVTDGFGNPKSGVTVTWTVTGGGGSITPSSATNGSGIALATRVLGTIADAGTHTAQAAVTGLSGSPVSFSATATAGTATTISLAGGDGQTDTVGATLATPYTVLVTDGFGNPKAGVTVNWTVTSGGGSIPASSVTNAAGIAAATRTLGTVTGTHTADADVTGLSGTPIGFTATATPGTAASLLFSVPPGNGTTVTPLSPQPEVTILDSFGNVVTDYSGSVVMTIETNPGFPVAGQLLGTTTVTVVNGVAVFTDLQIDQLGAGYTLRATAGSLFVISAGFTIL